MCVFALNLSEMANLLYSGKPGELCVSGYLVQKGYWEDDEQTRNVVRKHPQDKSGDEGIKWMHTGDVAIMDGDGYLSSKHSRIIRIASKIVDSCRLQLSDGSR